MGYPGGIRSRYIDVETFVAISDSLGVRLPDVFCFPMIMQIAAPLARNTSSNHDTSWTRQQ